jgi:hypothetical protein
MSLNPGRQQTPDDAANGVDPFTGSMTEAIENEFKAEWGRMKKTPLPQADPTDSRILYVAIARGVLAYLAAHHDDMVNGITLDVPGDGPTPFTVTGLGLDVTL